MEQLFELFLKHGLRPLSFLTEAVELEQTVNRSELAAILIIQMHEEMTMSELASALGVPLSTMTSLAKRLVHKGLMNRKQSGTDQRITLIRLTAEGHQLASQAKEMMNRVLERVQTTLSQDELTQLLFLIQKVVKALSQGDDSMPERQPPVSRKIQIED